MNKIFNFKQILFFPSNRKKILRIQLLIPFLFAFIFSSCLKEDPTIYHLDGLSNRQRMNRLKIVTPLVWNSHLNQSIGFGSDKQIKMKSCNEMQEYPKGENYYFALFEDLFPSEGDYDFNDVIIKSKLGLKKSDNEITGYIESVLHNDGGSLPVKIGLMFYEVKGKKYTRIPNENITINGVELIAGGEPWMAPLPELGDSWKIHFTFQNKNANIWINYFIFTDQEILTGGFAPSIVEEFELPHSYFLNDGNLPWGLEIEAKEFAIPAEKELFLNAYPEFEEWAESGGTKNKRWYESPDPEYTQD